MSIFTWLKEHLVPGTLTMSVADEAEFWTLAASLYVRQLAFHSCVNVVANAISKCEIKTFEKRKEKRGEEFYLWNVQPNRNQCSSVFMHKLIAKLYEDNEALIIEPEPGEMLVADSFTLTVYAMKDYKFENVEVDEFIFKRPFYQKDVMYFKLNNSDIRKLVSGLHESYGQLAEYAQKAYRKSRGQKGVFEVARRVGGKPEDAIKEIEMLQNNFKSFFDADSAVLPLKDGQKYTELNTKTYNADSTRDIRAQIDDVFIFTARAFQIPPVLVLGEVADTSKAVDAFLTFCIDPLCDLIQEEQNRKRYTRQQYLNGNFITIDTKTIKHIDLLAVAGSIEKLIGSGAFSPNDVRKAVRDEPIDEPWAKEHYLTLNFERAEDATRRADEAAGGSSGGAE